MTRYKIGHERERNGYHDSDWYCLVFDDVDGKIKNWLVGTTRGSMEFYDGVKKECPDHVMKMACEVAEREGLEIVRSRDYAKRAQEAGYVGTAVVTIKQVQNRHRKTRRDPCDKCGESGNWINPHNPEDKRPCFRCDGTGSAQVPLRGKGSMICETIDSGARGTVLRVFTKKSRHGTWEYGTTVTVQRADGSIFRAPLEALRADREIISHEEARKIAKKLGDERNFESLFA